MHSNRIQQSLVEALLLGLILLLAAYLRLAHVATNPGWYTDEGTHLDIARHLLAGEVQYMAVGQSMLLFARPPLFHLALAGWFGLFGVSIAALRSFTGLLGVLAVLLLYVLVRGSHNRSSRDGGAKRALLAAGALALYPQAVLYSRMGYSYHLMTPLLLLALLAVYRYSAGQRRGWLAAAALLLGCGVLVDLSGGALVAALALVLLLVRPRDLLWSLPLAALPFGLYALALLLSVPQAFTFDLAFTLNRLGGSSLAEQLTSIGRNVTMLLASDLWLVAGAAGLLLLKPVSLRGLALLFSAVYVLVMGRTLALYGLSLHYMIPLMPLVALGVAGLLHDGLPRMWAGLREGLGAVGHVPERMVTLLAGGALVLPGAAALAFVLALPFLSVAQGWQTAFDPLLVRPADAQTVAALVNRCAMPDDLVIASPGIAWVFTVRVADFQMAVAITGEDAVHLPGSTPLNRYVYDPHVENAAYVVVDGLWRGWGSVHMPGAVRLLAHVEQAWTPVLTAGQLSVYANPRRNTVNFLPECFSARNVP